MRLAGSNVDVDPREMDYTADRMAGVVHTIAPEMVNHIANTCILGADYLSGNVPSSAPSES